MKGLEAVHQVLQSELSRIVRDIPCGQEHPESGLSCVLKRWPPHVKHKTELSQRWESESG